MKKTMIKRKLALGLVTGLAVTSFTGCGSFTGEDVTKYQLVPMVTKSEAVDYYSQSLKYDSVVSKNVTVHETTYETKDVTGDKAEKLKSLVSVCEKALSQNKFEYSTDKDGIISESTYNYVKGLLDNVVLTNGTIVNMSGALGYYFVDVKYDLGPQAVGKFTKQADYLGLAGTWLTKYDGTYETDTAYLRTVVAKLNEYFRENTVFKTATFNESENIIDITDGKTPDGKELVVVENADASNDSVDTKSNSVVPSERKVELDIELINRVVGSALSQKSFLPELSLVYETAALDGSLSGYGIYPAGSNGLKIFGLDREKLAGTVTLRYVFKESVDGSGKILGTNIYCADEEVTTGPTVSSDNVIVPEFLREKLEQIVERADRLQANGDVASMLTGTVYEDKGFAVLRAFKEKDTNILKHMSTIRQVAARDTQNNAYLLEVESTIIEGSRSVDCCGTYRDRSYVVVQQQGDVFVVSDWLRVSRQMVKEPAINADSATEKRLVALNLSGEVSDSSKEDIRKLMSSLYTAGTNRVLSKVGEEGKEITVDGETVTIYKGILDCFNSDVSMLSSDELDTTVSLITTELVKYGTNIGSTFSGTVTEWIGGYDNQQAEFTTEELISYDGKGVGQYMTVYYLVSKMNDEWVIDERTIMDQYKIEGSELEAVKSRLGQ